MPLVGIRALYIRISALQSVTRFMPFLWGYMNLYATSLRTNDLQLFTYVL